eukprot:104739_1
MDKTNPFKNLVSVIGIHFQQNKGVKITQEKYDWIRRMLKKLCVQDDISAKITFNEYPKKSGRYSLSFNNMFWKMDKGNILGKLLSMSQLERDDAEKYYHFYVAELKKLFKMDNIPVAMSKSLTSQQFVEETYMQQKHDETKKQDHEQKQFNVPNEFHIKQDEIVIICNPLVVLICIEQYNHHRIKNIPGASIDKQNMIDLFYYKYNYDMIYNENKSCTQSEFDNIIRIAQNEFGKDENNYDCIICIFSGHGTEHKLICSDQFANEILRSKFEKAFNGNKVPNKVSAHKLFFIDACRDLGNKRNILVHATMDKQKSIKTYHPDVNTIIFHPNTKGHQSYSETTGGILIYALSKIMFDENRDYSKSLSEIEKIMRSKMERDIIVKHENGSLSSHPVLINVSCTIPFGQTDNIYFARNDIPKSQRSFRLSHPELIYKCSNIVFK